MAVVVVAADHCGMAAGGNRDLDSERRVGMVLSGQKWPLLRPFALAAVVDPDPSPSEVVAGAAEAEGGVAVGGERDCLSKLTDRSGLAATFQLDLLFPSVGRIAGEDPDGAVAIAYVVCPDEGGVPVGRERHGEAEVAVGRVSHPLQFAPILPPAHARTSEHPRRPEATGPSAAT